MAVPRPRPTSPPAGTVLGTPTAPTLSFQDAITQYQRQNPVSSQAYEGLFPYLQNLGFQVERPTHAGGTLPSDDKIVNTQTGEVFDLISDVGSPNQGWTFGASGYWYDGRPQAQPRNPGGGPTPNPVPPNAPHGGNPNNAPATGTAIPRGSETSRDYSAAYRAQSRIRQQARNQGRSSTILGGFNTGPIRTMPATVLGSTY